MAARTTIGRPFSLHIHNGSKEKTMSHNTARKSGTILTIAAAIGASVIAAAPAQAKSAPPVQASGSCTGGGVWHLKAKHDSGRIEIEYQVDTNHAGQVWRVGISDNNVRVFAGNRRTLAPSGAFTVRLLTADRAGADIIRTRAVFGARSCAGSVRL
jgi:hypothetical protein